MVAEAPPVIYMVMGKAEFDQLVDDVLQERLGYPDEQGLIEILNKYEYQLQIEQDSPLAMSTISDGGQERRRQISILRDHLARRQGGTLDRFGLRNLSNARLQQLQLDTQRDLADLEAQVSSHSSSNIRQPSFFESLFKDVSQIAFGSHPTRYQIFVNKRLLSEIAIKIKHDSAPKPFQPPDKNQHKMRLEQELATLKTELARVDGLALDEGTKRAMKNSINDKIREKTEDWTKCL